MTEQKKRELLKEALRQARHGLWTNRATLACMLMVPLSLYVKDPFLLLASLFSALLAQMACQAFSRWEADALREIAFETPPDPKQKL